MPNVRSRLLPILRSETQARLLAALLLEPGREASISDLAREIGADPGNLHGEVTRLVDARILADRRVGRTRLLRDAGSPYSAPLAELLLLAYGPKPLLESALRGIDGVDEAFIFGSWAARYEGVEGGIPHDVDVLVVGSPDRDEVYELVADVAQQLRRDVQVAFRTPSAWANTSNDAFLTTVRSRPLVRLDLGRDAE